MMPQSDGAPNFMYALLKLLPAALWPCGRLSL